MDTYFAHAARASEKDLAAEIEIVSKSPVLDGLKIKKWWSRRPRGRREFIYLQHIMLSHAE